ncbi:transcriptional regulator BetI [Tropicimonas isoalkanivorans]|uniref:HTH-type transcriptional regulator BetI n=1 Tax=Tropicimonas isoalkanivorans TaxID=441112 RepID=A0A1I1EIS2_9RHOB|nr:transcriptional regulator, TetR family [Tropicimonas isoalkanivorans]
MEPIRRTALVEATIHEIGVSGTLDVPVSKIARRAGVSSALAHHYFGNKEQLFLDAMRHMLTLYAKEVRRGLSEVEGPRARLEAVVAAGFRPFNFQREAIAAWLNFYVLAQTSVGAQRLLNIYHRRLHSTLVHDLRPLVGDEAPRIARLVAALIDGLYLRHALLGDLTTGEEATWEVMHALDVALAASTREQVAAPTPADIPDGDLQ